MVQYNSRRWMIFVSKDLVFWLVGYMAFAKSSSYPYKLFLIMSLIDNKQFLVGSFLLSFNILFLRL